ncbi:MAG: hypothetical protein IPM68_14960 [Flavobacteriales bacterium]|nr:hypothetical protein [Flavobacteriales bacterium]
MSLVWTYYYGEVDIAYWEYLVGSIYLVVIYIYFSRVKTMAIKKHPEYKHLLWGFFAKIIGGLGFSLIYFYYYNGGDTIMYFYSAVAMSNMFWLDPMTYFDIVTGPNSPENLARFSMETGYPIGTMFFEPRAYFVIRLISPMVIMTFNSYMITTVVLASMSYVGIWKCFRTFSSMFPSLTDKFAVAFLYMPSVVFWGSGIMKDTFTMSAVCWWIHCFVQFFFKRRSLVGNFFGMVLAAIILVVMKPYIFMSIFPVSMIWLMFNRVAGMKNALIRFVVLPVALAVMLFLSVTVLSWLGDNLDKFSLDKVVDTVMVLQEDMSRAEQYGSNYFDVGPMDGTLGSLLSKFPVATNAALFRPYLWEARSVVVALSALENLWLLGLTLLMLWRTRVLFFLRCIGGNPVVLMCFVFTLLFGFAIGISTPNFGALVRFKIPLIPLMVSALYIIGYLNRERIWAKVRNRVFDLKKYRTGEMGAEGLISREAVAKRKRTPQRA